MANDPYDRGGRYLQRGDDELLRWFLTRTASECHVVTWLDTRSLVWPGAPEQTRDTLAHVLDLKRGGFPWAMLVEFSWTPDFEMLSRALMYLAEARIKIKPSKLPGDRFHIGAVIVNLRGKGDSSLDMDWPEAGLRTCVMLREVNLIEFDASWILDGIDVGAAPQALLGFIPLMQRGDEDGIITRWRSLLDRETNPIRRADLAYCAGQYAEGIGCEEPWRKALRGVNMIESKFFNDLAQVKVDEAVAEAVTKTEIRTNREFIQELLRDRIGPPPTDLVAALAVIADRARLSVLRRIAGQVSSFEQFRQEAGL